MNERYTLYAEKPNNKDESRGESISTIKEPWQMMREEVYQAAKALLEPGAKDIGFWSAERHQLLNRQVAGHYQIIKQALSEGKPVPPEVLRDYPELKPAETGQAKCEITEKDIQGWMICDNSRPVATAIAKLRAMGLLEYAEGHSRPGGLTPFSIRYKDPKTGQSKFLCHPTEIKKVVDELWEKRP